MIRAAAPDDRARLREIRTWLSEPTPGLLETTLSGSGLVFVSTAEGRPVGYVLATLGDDAYVAELAVEPAYRREGRATELLQIVVSAARERGYDGVSLTVHEENDAARALYDSLGFELRREEPDYYADGGTALVLGREC
ncbi:GNAT family N-acetyltransferase [Haladaptatus salinisoli]|uniref:GNAT family N-acetyltransferase n=1 Tax=Haladaptatus salinisoli TaxID=2884876 RepID=UPI001D0B9068|nr:N-acetyltransferase [Haladaptatus salinisoli]